MKQREWNENCICRKQVLSSRIGWRWMGWTIHIMLYFRTVPQMWYLCTGTGYIHRFSLRLIVTLYDFYSIWMTTLQDHEIAIHVKITWGTSLVEWKCFHRISSNQPCVNGLSLESINNGFMSLEPNHNISCYLVVFTPSSWYLDVFMLLSLGDLRACQRWVL